MAIEEEKFFAHFDAAVAGGENLEDDLGGDVVFFPLFVGAAIAFGTTENHHDIGGGDGLGLSLDGIPEEVACNKDLWIVDVEEV